MKPTSFAPPSRRWPCPPRHGLRGFALLAAGLTLAAAGALAQETVIAYVVDGARDWRPLLREHAAKLFCVTINGATIGAESWTNGRIRPLDEGDFDNRALLAALRDVRYRGPIGLMRYGVPGDPRDHLARSMRTWRHPLPTVMAEP